MALGVAGVALGDIDFRFTWQSVTMDGVQAMFVHACQVFCQPFSSIRSCFAARYLSEILRGHRAGERKTEVAFTDRLSLRSVRAAFDPTWEEILASRRSRQGRSTCILWFT